MIVYKKLRDSFVVKLRTIDTNINKSRGLLLSGETRLEKYYLNTSN